MNVSEYFKSRVLIAPTATGTTGGGYLAPTPGINALTVRAVINMGNAEDLALSLKSADDTTGTNAVDFEDVPIFVDGTRETTDDHGYTVAEDTGSTIVDFLIQPGQVPDGKTIGLTFALSNAANLISAEIIEDTIYKPAV